MERLTKIILTLLLTGTSLMTFADVEESRDLFFRSGKYFVVVGVLVILFIVLFGYLFRLDRKVSELEKESNEK
jgi:CcmD family protein